ncbi:hypothetical protein JCM8097_000205 [Rhodosporidiobolus ruineniae]
MVPPPPRATSSPAPPSPALAGSPTPPSRPSSPSSTLLSNSVLRPAGSKKGDILQLSALLSDLSVLSSARGQGLLAGEGGKADVFAPSGPAPPVEEFADAYAPKPAKDELAEEKQRASLAAVRSGNLGAPTDLTPLDAVQLAEEWIQATAGVLERAREELDGAGKGEAGKVGRAERVEERAREVGRGLEVGA